MIDNEMECNRHILVTGAATGIGAATVRRFIAGGWGVTAFDINAGALEALEAEMRDTQSGCRVLCAAGDTRDREAVRRAVADGIDANGPLTAVFANAGIHRSNTLLDISDAELHNIIDINIYGNINTLQAAVPAITEAGGGSVVINCSDQWFVGKAHSFGYGLTKGALGQMTRSLAVDLAPSHIRVNAVCPGTIDTPLVDGVFERLSARTGVSVEAYKAEEDALFLTGRMGRADEVAALVYFLCGEDAAFITGGHYLIDGGLVAGR